MSGLPIAMQEKVLMTRLQSFCEQLSTAEQATFSLPASSTIDVGGSFLPPTTDLDFFDLNEKGEIVVQSVKPMFPEDFPPNYPEHPLSWWGVVDPIRGGGNVGGLPSSSSGVGGGPNPHRHEWHRRRRGGPPHTAAAALPPTRPQQQQQAPPSRPHMRRPAAGYPPNHRPGRR